MMADIFRNDLIKQLDNFNPGRSKQKFTCLGCHMPTCFGKSQNQLNSDQQAIFDVLKFILSSAAWGNKTKEIYYSLVSLKMIVFCFIPPSLGVKNEFNISKMVDWLKKLFQLYMFGTQDNEQRRLFASDCAEVVSKVTMRLFPTPENYKQNGYKLSAQRLLGSFELTSFKYDWLMVPLNTIDQS